MRRIFEHACPEGHVTERLIDDTLRTTDCEVCGKPAERIFSATRSQLDGTDPSLPGAYMRWETKRYERMAYERKRTERHGPSSKPMELS